jgi:hypothetical protein
MKSSRNTFVFNVEWYNILRDYPAEVRLEVYDAMMEYVATGILADLKPMAKMAFAFIKKEIDANIEKYNETCRKRSEAGKIGNEKRWENKNIAKVANAISVSQKSQSIANIADNDNDNDYKEKISKDISKKGSKKIDASKIKNISAEFIPLMQTWFDYKQSRREMYKTMQSASVCYKSLYDLSNGNPTMAERIINQSIANNWAGLFEIKTTSNGTTFKSYQQAERDFRAEQNQQFADHIRQKLAGAIS